MGGLNALLVVGLAIAVAIWSRQRWQHKQIGLPSCEMTYHYSGYIPQELPHHARYSLLLYRDASIQYGACRARSTSGDLPMQAVGPKLAC